MGIQINQGGTWKSLANAFVNVSNTWTQVKSIYVNKAGVWTSAWQNEVKVTLASQSASINLRSLFDASTWSSTTTKRVSVPAGVTINSNNWLGAIYLDAGTAWGGDLIVDIAGTLYGTGGVYLSNSGEGGAGIGSAIAGASGQRIAVNLLSGGVIKAGGGAGGLGGQGGAGSYTAVASDQTLYSYPSNYYWEVDGFWGTNIRWSGAQKFTTSGDAGAGPLTGNDGATYYRGTLQSAGSYSDGGDNMIPFSRYAVRRVAYSTVGTSGGAGGYGGRGQGADGAAASGASGSAGGTNAGAGGAGGTGGAWGAQGGTGSTGSAGNAGSGASGAAGGAAGRYAYGYLTFNNAGTTAGRLALA